MYFIYGENVLRKRFFPALIFLIGGLSFNSSAQTEIAGSIPNEEKQIISERGASETVKPLVVSVLPNYYNQTESISLAEIIKRAFETSGEVKIARLEVERAKARFSKLKFYAGVPFDESLKLREDINSARFPNVPPTIETAVAVALRSRPEIRLAELEENLASAGLRLVRAQSRPDVTAYTRYTQERSVIADPCGAFAQRDRGLTFGVAIGLPVFNKNQGARAEAEIAIRQAQERRAFAEQVIRNEIATAFLRIEATNRALSTLETAVLPRSRQNIETIRQVYQVGELKITDLIAEQRRLLDANRDLTETLTERYRAQADLFIALGITLEN